jgi:hypothetical protein
VNLLAPVNRDNFNRPFNPFGGAQSDVRGRPGSFPLDPAGLVGLFARIHALGLAHLASGGNPAGQSDGPDQRGAAPQVPSQALPGGLLALLATAPASGASPLLANEARGTTDTTTPDTADASQVEDRAQQRYVAGIADQMNGESSATIDGVTQPIGIPNGGSEFGKPSRQIGADAALPHNYTPIVQQAARRPTTSECVDRCLHLLPSPSGDLQSSEFRLCVARCLGRL